MGLSLLPLGHHHHHPQLLLNSPLHNRTITQKGVSRKRHLLSLPCRCANDHSSSRTEAEPSIQGRRSFSGFLLAAAAGLNSCDIAEAVSTSRRALRGSKIPESDFTTLPNGLKYYDLKVGGGAQAVKGSRVAVHYVAKWKNITFMTSRQGLGVNGGSPYGFDVGQSERGSVLKGLDLGVEGMRVGGQSSEPPIGNHTKLPKPLIPTLIRRVRNQLCIRKFGPFKVLQKINDNVYIVDLPAQRTSSRVLYKGTDADGLQKVNRLKTRGEAKDSIKSFD